MEGKALGWFEGPAAMQPTQVCLEYEAMLKFQAVSDFVRVLADGTAACVESIAGEAQCRAEF